VYVDITKYTANVQVVECAGSQMNK